MNNTAEKVTGTVQAVGTQWSGSVKVNEVWYSNKKGFVNPAKQGDEVVLTLTPWEFKGKTGSNITAVNVVTMAPLANKEEPVVAAESKKIADTYKTRDFDAENRGKVRHGLSVALAPLVATDTISLDRLKAVVESLVPFVMGD